MKRIILILSVLVVIAGVVGGIVFRTQYVFLDDKVYKKDVKELDLYYSDNDVDELNKCSELEELIIRRIDDEFLTEMRTFQHLEHFTVFSSDIINDGMSKINSFPILNDMFIAYSHIDFGKMQNDSVKEISLYLSEIINITELANCRSLTNLDLFRVVMDNKIIVTQVANTLDLKYTLKDSSDFSCLDNIRTLKISCIDIEDISGFMEMDSLKTLTVSQGYISEENISALENNGITVMIKNKEE
ncbi:MAG: hypothetical protein MJ079_06755 [Ruminococcus sp.]|nr:hypothetical protein [Ruminococcus sp.]